MCDGRGTLGLEGNSWGSEWGAVDGFGRSVRGGGRDVDASIVAGGGRVWVSTLFSNFFCLEFHLDTHKKNNGTNKPGNIIGVTYAKKLITGMKYYQVRRVVWFSSYNCRFVVAMSLSCNVTRFLMWWYLSRISLHLDMVFFPLIFFEEWQMDSSLRQIASTSGLASTDVAGPEFPPTIALKQLTIIKILLLFYAVKIIKVILLQDPHCKLHFLTFWD